MPLQGCEKRYFLSNVRAVQETIGQTERKFLEVTGLYVGRAALVNGFAGRICGRR